MSAEGLHGAGKNTWLLLASDGLFANEERGGGGGLSNEEIGRVVSKQSRAPVSETVDALMQAAQQAGSTDDITIILLRLADN